MDQKKEPILQMTSTNDQSRVSKFLVIGECEIGKTSALEYFCAGKPAANYIRPTKGCEIHIKTMKIEEEEHYAEFWDLAGDWRINDCAEIYTRYFQENIKKFKGILFFFDSSMPKTVRYLMDYLNTLFGRDQQMISHEIPLVVIGTKFDQLGRSNISRYIEKAGNIIQNIFEKENRPECIFISSKEPVSQFSHLQNFISNCIKGTTEKIFHFNPTQPLGQLERGKKYAEKRLSVLARNISIIAGVLTSKREFLYIFGFTFIVHCNSLSYTNL